MIMTYIIQNRLVRICCNDRDFGEQLKEISSQQLPGTPPSHHINPSQSPVLWHHFIYINTGIQASRVATLLHQAYPSHLQRRMSLQSLLFVKSSCCVHQSQWCI